MLEHTPRVIRVDIRIWLWCPLDSVQIGAGASDQVNAALAILPRASAIRYQLVLQVP